jgi:hypothetical protein
MNATHRKVDRTGWPPGPWDDEPDRIEWRTQQGFPAMIIRNASMGNLCGYVGIPSDHPAREHAEDFRVHGGVTYAAPCAGHICHVPEPGASDDVFWLGFDCGHWEDVWPGQPVVPLRHREAVYRDVAYVRAECEALAAECATYSPKKDG